jgi:catechol-2,3-dioxygenase
MTNDTRPRPALTLGHVTLAVQDIDRMVDFYCDTLGFHVTNRGEAPDGAEMAFLCQDPTAHHQIVLISGMAAPEHHFVLADHMAFRTSTLDDLRLVGERLAEAGIEGVIPISHGNAWSLYFSDPEGNGLECFVDSPFHVAQPYAGGVDLASSDEEIAATTRAEIESLPEFQPFDEWRAAFAARLETGG